MRMDRQIEIHSKTVTKNEDGRPITEYVLLKTMAAGVTHLFGGEYFAAAAIKQEDTIKFTTRFDESVTTEMRIKFRDKMYEITFIDNIKEQDMWMEIKAKVI